MSYSVIDGLVSLSFLFFLHHCIFQLKNPLIVCVNAASVAVITGVVYAILGGGVKRRWWWSAGLYSSVWVCAAQGILHRSAQHQQRFTVCGKFAVHSPQPEPKLVYNCCCFSAMCFYNFRDDAVSVLIQSYFDPCGNCGGGSNVDVFSHSWLACLPRRLWAWQ